MNLVINNNIIDSNLEDILKEIRQQTDGRFLKDIIRRGDNIAITCPWHKDGLEKHPSCYIYVRNDSDEVPFGFYKCFTCGSKGQLYQLVSRCLNYGIEEAKQWLIDNFSKTITEELISLPEINLNNSIKKEYLDESILNQYAYFHPYMFKRKLTEDVIVKYKIGWNKENNTITFPIWDEYNNLLGITERNIDNKYFHIPEGIGKPVYLLNFIKKENITEVIVCEGQIDALVACSYGRPAVALLGAGTTTSQMNILNRSGIRHFILMYDNDLAGRHGAERFKKLIKKDVLVTDIIMPKNKDVADLTYEEFIHILSKNGC